MNDKFITNRALIILKELAATENEVSIGKLHSSWAKLLIQDIKIVGRSEDYTVVEAENSILPDTTYLMLSNAGELYEINDNGNFKI
ncbi:MULTISPECIES: DUF6488 family protein [unclassified Methylophaga]|jgi:hypothetical protein|uniref:DUF6488 family protein n=1 Tax=unclassified Methylophaga TaxID=2629249 RepID=UPI000C4EBA1C|nr:MULTISPECIES: DUF6488 family protein [unclassified Methylophaga]MAL50883.1 hypothetical protein [Methylophaga sp.]MAM29588.1 hypothetical protein [Flavobacteriaceae bacterium]MBP23817.1 hypothetical protein [Methylophaga sp.]HCC80028.1 hypothetical protein [Methylophaga sp.]|tara:strand:- start:2248 stop:2505 length:258 start_codon:yes stop_codon:yes gene_type:complete